MKTRFSFTTVLFPIYIVALVTFMSLVSVAGAQENQEASEADGVMESIETVSEQEEAVTLERMVVVGTRAKPRSVIRSAVPIDVLPSADFIKQSGRDLPDLLRNLVPSYNVNAQPINDTATVVRPANLRGLAPDHTLLLVNGKRRHRASVIVWQGNGLAEGAQSADLSPIPAIALKRVEVLRDGASAQYGSDAIAGVMDLQLKDNYKGGSLQIRPGIFQAGDGLAYSVAGNIGLGREDLWTNLSLEYGNTAETERAIQRADAAALIAAGNQNIEDPAQKWGHPVLRNDIKFFANYGGHTMSEDIKFYGHLNYAQKQVEGGFYYRNPNTRAGVFSNDEGETLLVGRLSGEGEVPTVAITDGVPDPVALKQVFDDPDLFTFQELFPGGFTPRFGADTQDASFLFGLRGAAIEEKLGWDVSASYGRHASDFFLKNTINASLGPDTPTDFDPGDYIQADTNVNLDATYPLHEIVFLASGVEYRVETFEVVPGQIESWKIGPLASQGFSSGSNGFPGFSNIAKGRWTRANFAGYLETEVVPLDFWTVAAAMRGEYFDDFGSTLNYKVATNYGITDTLREYMTLDAGVDIRLRGSYSTGFRAPTPGQQNTFNIQTTFDENNRLVDRGTIPSTHAAAGLVGGKALEPEKSANLTFGVVFSHDIASVTVDYFNIKVEDRLALSRDFVRGEDITDAQIEQLVEEGITNAANLTEFNFLTNEFETGTQGVDVVLTAPVLEGAISLAYNWTDTAVTDRNPEILDDVRVRLLQEGVPRHRGNLMLTQAIDFVELLGRINYYGPWYENRVGDQTYGEAVLVDLEMNFVLVENMSMVIGVHNVFDVEPDNVTEAMGPEIPGVAPEDFPAFAVGRPFGEFSPYGFGGAFWYAKVGYNF